MTNTAKIRRQGGATVFSIPPALLKMLGVEVGAELTLVVSNGALVATPTVAKKRYTLAELLEGADEMSALNKQAAAWNVSPPVGNEVS
ncbi:PbsX family transcriptional regulator [Rhizobium sp. L43]|uniref:AbrB/MazE/SpoVT family DNA-binding domain-containing protein n=1 Tax=Rhizobium sp. L43 TaxID=2035452 RepID=UPI000BEA9645|nr:PbsX family transcriptional regulator [Rhizobium sp. L43]PDS78509.1 PbsX family transcriptional regulator [Rhizobium sp. L43]